MPVVRNLRRHTAIDARSAAAILGAAVDPTRHVPGAVAVASRGNLPVAGAQIGCADLRFAGCTGAIAKLTGHARLNDRGQVSLGAAFANHTVLAVLLSGFTDHRTHAAAMHTWLAVAQSTLVVKASPSGEHWTTFSDWVSQATTDGVQIRSLHDATPWTATHVCCAPQADGPPKPPLHRPGR